MAINNCDQQEFDLLLQERQEHSNRTSWMFHLNMSSLQNKFDELKLLNDEMKSQIIFLSEKKIDISHSNSQFTLTGYNMYRKDREKGGGGMIAYFDSSLPSEDLKVTKRYKTLDWFLQWKLALSTTKSFFLGYTDPKAVGSLTTPTLLRTCWGGTEWQFSVGVPQETDFYYYRWSEPGQAKTRKQWRENTCRPKKKCMECNVKLPSRRGLSQYQRHCWTLFKSTNSTFSRQEALLNQR